MLMVQRPGLVIIVMRLFVPKESTLSLETQSKVAFRITCIVFHLVLSIYISGQLEIQQIHCRGATNGTFRLSFRGNLSRPIPYDANAADLKSFIEEMYT